MFEKKIRLNKEELVVLLNYVGADYTKMFEDLKTPEHTALSSEDSGTYYVIPKASGLDIHVSIVHTVSLKNPGVSPRNVKVLKSKNFVFFIPFKK